MLFKKTLLNVKQINTNKRLTTLAAPTQTAAQLAAAKLAREAAAQRKADAAAKAAASEIEDIATPGGRGKGGARH